MKNISIVIPSWNGKNLLKRFLPALIKAVTFYRQPIQIIVVDNGSNDGTIEFLHSQYPCIEAISLKNNCGFGRAADIGIAASKAELVVLLNNDVEPKEDFLVFLPDNFNDPEVFAVRIKSIIVEGQKLDQVESWVGAEFRLGFIYGLNESEYKNENGLSFTAGGGAMILDREKFNCLGGFDDIFLPFYWEDTDLCYRAWKNGLKIIYEPRSIVNHYHRSTISRSFNSGYINFIGERNRYLVIWKNLTDAELIIKHLLFIPLRLARNILSGRWASVFGFFAALGRMGAVLKRRKIGKQNATRTDKEIFDIFMRNKVNEEIIKVLYLDEWPDIHGGGQIYLLNLLKEIDRKKISPILICPSLGTFADAAKNIGVGVKVIKMKRLVNPLNIFSFLVSVFKIVAIIKKEGVNIVHSNAAVKGTIYAGLAAKITGVPLVWNVHVLYSAGLRDRFLVMLADKIIVVAEALRVRFKWLKAQDKIVVNHNGVDLSRHGLCVDMQSARKNTGLADVVPVVGVIGILDPVKGQEYFLKAARQVLESFPEAKFLLVGEDLNPGKEYKRMLENLVNSLGISKSVVFTGWLENVSYALASLDVFVLASVKDHFPLVVLEAMACSKPVVATNVGGVSEMVINGATGILIPAADDKRLANAIISLLKDKAMAERMGLAGRKRAEEFFDIKLNAKRIEKVYEDLLKTKV